VAKATEGETEELLSVGKELPFAVEPPFHSLCTASENKELVLGIVIATNVVSKNS
jgi:hypothetical protein